MFLRVAARRSVLDSPGTFRQLLDVTSTSSPGHGLRGHRRLCASVGGVERTHLRARRPPPPHSERAATWCGSPPHARGYTCLLAGNWGVPRPRGSGGTTRQSRAHSTAAKNQPADSDNKEDDQNLKEASTTMSSSTEKAPGEPEPEGGPLNKTQQLKKVFKEYGAVGVSFHIGMSLMSLGMFYLLVSSGIDIAALLCKLGFSEAVVQSKMAAGTSTFVLAYAIHKLFAPVRISITLVSVPLIVRYFRKTGLFKPPTPAP